MSSFRAAIDWIKKHKVKIAIVGSVAAIAFPQGAATVQTVDRVVNVILESASAASEVGGER